MNTELIQYQNANQSFDDVIKNFIVRQKEFERVIDDIKSTKEGSSFQHYVFVGRRGSGKSTLLRRIQAEIVLNKKLNEKYIVVNLGEEQSGIYKLYDLWDYVIRNLNAIGNNIAQLDFRLYKNDMKAYTKALHSQVIKALQANKKKLILLVDNIDRVLDTRGNEEEGALLRELLMNFKEVRIIGCSTVMSEHFWKYDMPFYQFFSIKKLEALSIDEVNQLLMHWSEVKKLPEIKKLIKRYPGKIQSIRMLTDGMPRTMLLFVDMLINRPNQNGYSYLQLIVDRATPIYQERLSILSPAQNKVLTELAFFWDAATVEQLVPKCNMDGKTISALLNQLTTSRYVEKIKGNTKNLLYRLEERFFNLWFNMTQGMPQQRLEAKALIDFLEKWYDDEELKMLCTEMVDSFKTGKVKQDYAESMSLALLNSTKVSKGDRQNLYLAVSKSGLVEKEKLGAAQKHFDNIEEVIDDAINRENYQKIVDIINISSNNSTQKKVLLVWCFLNLAKYELVDVQLKEIENDSEALFFLAFLYNKQGKEKDAEKYYLLAIEKGDVNALNNLALLYDNQGKEKDAEKYYLLAVEKECIKASNNILINYYKKNKKIKLKNLFNKLRKETINAFLVKYHDFATLIYLYLGEMDTFKKMSDIYLEDGGNIVSEDFIVNTLIHKQTNWVYNYFEINKEAKEMYKPLYYATLFLKGNEEQELLKMPPEISENVNDIIKTVNEKQVFYYG